MVHSLDAFTSSLTRLVVFVDGLDNCEQVFHYSNFKLLESDFNEPSPSFLNDFKQLFHSIDALMNSRTSQNH